MKIRVMTIKDYKNLPKGSCIEIEKETKTLYIGIWSSCMGTYTVKVPKKYCEQ